MAKARKLTTVASGQTALERVALIDSQLALIEQVRQKQHVDTDAVADGQAVPLIEERAALAEQLQAWWPSVASQLLAAKRKTVVLGGCTIGTKLGAKKLKHGFLSDAAAVDALMLRPWAKKALLRTSWSLDRIAISAALDSKRGTELRELGFSVEQAETFVLARAEQAGTVTSA